MYLHMMEDNALSISTLWNAGAEIENIYYNFEKTSRLSGLATGNNGMRTSLISLSTFTLILQGVIQQSASRRASPWKLRTSAFWIKKLHIYYLNTNCGQPTGAWNLVWSYFLSPETKIWALVLVREKQGEKIISIQSVGVGGPENISVNLFWVQENCHVPWR